MNRQPRVLMIGRHYWPHGSLDSAAHLMQIAGALSRRGLQVEIFTPRYASTWPRRIVVREIVVHREVAAARSDWSIGRYVRGLAAWLGQHGASYQVLVADSMREESIAVVDAARQLGIKSVLHCRGWGKSGDVPWWSTGRSTRRCVAASKNSDAQIVSAASSERELLVEGFDPSRVHRIHWGFRSGENFSEDRRRLARRSLATANGDLHTEAETPVVLCAASMVRDGGIDLLMRAAHPLVTRYPDLRLWFVGDGPNRDTMYQYLRSEGVRASIAMPGSFAEMQDLFRAADVYVQLDEDGLNAHFPSAVEHELPVVAVDAVPIRERLRAAPEPLSHPEQQAAEAFESEKNQVNDAIFWCDESTPKSVRLGVSKALNDLGSARQRAAMLRRTLARRSPQSVAIDQYAGILERLARDVPPGKWNSPTEAIS